MISENDRMSNPIYRCPNCHRIVDERGFCSDRCKVEYRQRMNPAMV